MTNRVKGETSMVLKDGREFTLVLDMEAFVEAEGAYGKPMKVLMNDAALGFVGAVRALLYGALKTKHPTITLRECSDMFQQEPDQVSDALDRAADAAYPKQQEGEESQNPPLPGKNSGGNGAKAASTPKRSGSKHRELSA